VQWEILVGVIALGMFILAHVLRNNEEERRTNRNRTTPDRERPVTRRASRSEDQVDRFLEEVNRRRKQIAETRQRRPAPEAPPARSRQPGGLARRTAPPPKPRPLAEPMPAPRPAPAPEVVAEVIPLAVPVPSTPSQSSGLEGGSYQPAPGRAPLSEVTLGEKAKTIAPEMKQVAKLISSTQSLRTAMLLRIIMEPPLCRRLPGLFSLAPPPRS